MINPLLASRPLHETSRTRPSRLSSGRSTISRNNISRSNIRGIRLDYDDDDEEDVICGISEG